jgi:sucrose-6-phosphate hydrolase SacC (GH32 family)
MNFRKFFDYRFLSGEDFQKDQEVTLTIKDIRKEEVNTKGGKEQKPTIIFEQTEKMMVMNKTNAKRIAKLLSSNDTDDWKGKDITLYTESVSAFGAVVDAIRVKYERKSLNS